MTEVPKIVVDRLRAVVPAGQAHPDAALLTAFAEQALSETEREGVLEHLALCEQCREVVMLALPPIEAAATRVADEAEPARTTPSAAKPEKNWLDGLGWPGLRWAALAAGVVLGGSLLLLRHGNAPALTPANPQVAFTAPAPSTPQTAPPTDQVTTSARADMPQSKAETSAAGKSGSNELKAAQTPSQPAPAESGILLAENKAARKKEDSIRADKPSPAPASGARTLDSNASNLPSSVGETVNVSGEAVAVDTRDSATVLMARNEAPAVEKAKPAPPEIGAQQAPAEQIEATDQLKASAGQAAAGASSLAVNRAYAVKSKVLAKQALAPSFTWTIRAGVLQRSADGGQTWQSSLHSDHPLLCYTSAGGSVWAGGQAGTLFHSADGVSWVQIQPAVKGQPLSADITNIDVRRPTDVVLSTGNNETWSTSDGGKTWEKK